MIVSKFIFALFFSSS